MKKEKLSPTNSPLEISCTICSEPIKDYLPVYFHNVEMNPACLNCQGLSKSCESRNPLPGITSSSSMVTNMSQQITQLIAEDFGQESVDKENDEKMKTVLMGIRSKVKAKLEVRFRNGEISRVAMAALEEDLVKELKEELEEEFRGEKKKFDLFTFPGSS